MLGGSPIAEVEAALSAALTASLRVPSRERPAFIAELLVAAAEGKPAAAAAWADAPKTKPPGFDDELEEISELVRNAVNCAARHADHPLHRIADHLLRQGRSTVGLTLPGDDAFEAAVAPPLAVMNAPSAEPVPPAAPSSSSGNPLAAIIEQRRAGGASRDVPVLGKSSSTVLPSVIGAMQEEAAKRIAKNVDEGVIAEAMKAGAKMEGMQPDPPPPPAGRSRKVR